MTMSKSMDNKIIIWHNPRCRKSREGLNKVEEIVVEKNLKPEIRKYLENPPSVEELKSVLKMMNKKPIEIVRTKEAIWKEKYKDDFKAGKLDDDQIIIAMHENPKLIERPIVIFNDKAVLARPAEKVLELF